MSPSKSKKISFSFENSSSVFEYHYRDRDTFSEIIVFEEDRFIKDLKRIRGIDYWTSEDDKQTEIGAN